MKKISKRLRAPSPAMVVACLALTVSLSGVGYAAVALPVASVGTPQLKASAVTSAKIKNGQIATSDLAAGAVTGAKIADGQVTGADIDESTLGKVPSAAAADEAAQAAHAATADFAADAGTLDGLDSAAFLGANGKAADADRLDGVDSSQFLRTGSIKAATPGYVFAGGENGPLPVQFTFTSSGGQVVLFFSGTAYATTTGLKFIDVNVDGANVAAPGLYFNNTAVHQAFPGRMIVLPNLAAGQHTVQFVQRPGFNGLASDGQDRYYLGVLELPR